MPTLAQGIVSSGNATIVRRGLVEIRSAVDVREGGAALEAPALRRLGVVLFDPGLGILPAVGILGGTLERPGTRRALNCPMRDS
jgi:hypothetical protein